MDTTTDTQNPARIAAKWWADHLRTGRAPLNNGAGNAMVDMLAIMGQASTPPVATDDVQKFEDALARAIAGHPGFRSGWLTVGVDYGPDRILSDAASTLFEAP